MNDWIEYEWTVRGDPALFRVNISYEQEKPGGCDKLMYVAAAPKDENASFFSAKEVRRLSRVESKLKKIFPGSAYVGFIHLDAIRQFYFYVSDAQAAIDAAENLALSERVLMITAGAADEPDWLTYHALLLPDAAKYQTIYNEQLIARQRAAGDSLDKTRRVSFYVCFASDQQRQLFINDARSAGFAIGDALFEQELALSHVQTLYALATLDKGEIDALTTRAIRAAEPYAGEFLRWTCPKMSRRSPLS